jgi:hypothetical protein
MAENELSREIIGAAIEVHQALGDPGLLESIMKKLCAPNSNSVGFDVNVRSTFPSSTKIAG